MATTYCDPAKKMMTKHGTSKCVVMDELHPCRAVLKEIECSEVKEADRYLN